MRAAIGDRIVVAGRHLDEPVRDGEVLEVHGPDGSAPYLVRWSDNGHETLFFPGPDAKVAPVPHETTEDAKERSFGQAMA